MTVATPRQCTRCVMPESPPDVVMDANGLCSVCVEDARTRSSIAAEPPFLESDFTRILAKKPGKGDFDCLVMCSGGKDSTAALYYMVKKYRAARAGLHLRPRLRDRGGPGERAPAVECWGGFLQYRSTFMHEMFAAALKADAPVCSATCARSGTWTSRTGWPRASTCR